MEIRSLGFRTDLALLAHSGSVFEDRGTHLVIRTPENPTYYWGNCILLAAPPVPGGEREVIGAFHTEFPKAEHVSIGIDGTEDPGDLQAWRDAGLDVDVSTVLTAERLVQPLAPIGEVEVRPLVSDEDWEARAELGHHFADGMPREAFLTFVRGKNAQERRVVEAGRGQRFGAFVEGELVSTGAIFVTEPGIARYQSVETHPDHRRQGLASAVVHSAGEHALTSLGVTTLVIVAETDGEAIGLYRRLGFADVERQVQLEKPAPS